MTDDNHRMYSDWSAAYSLGALDPQDRKDFEHHLAGCGICAADLASFAPLPGLIAKVEPSDVGHRVDQPRAEAIAAVARVEMIQDQKRNQRWRIAALLGPIAAAVLVAIVLTAWGRGPTTPETVVALVTTSEVDQATISTSPRPWGTEVTLNLTGLPDRESYQAWSIDSDGAWSSIATWSPTPTGVARLTGATKTATPDIDWIVVTSADKTDVLVEAQV